MAEVVVFDEIMADAAEMAAEEIEVIGVVTEASEVTETSIDLSNTLDELLQMLNEDGLQEFLAADVEFAEGIADEVGLTVDNVLLDLTAEGIDDAFLGSAAGAELSQGSAVARAGADAARNIRGIWQTIKRYGGYAKKLAEVYIFVDIFGRIIIDIVKTIEDENKNPPWKGSLTEKQKAQLIKLQDSVGKLNPLMKGWESALKPLQDDTLMTYGTMTTEIGGRTERVQVINVVAYIIEDAIRQMHQANDAFKGGIDSLTVFDLTQLSNYVFGVFADAQALIDLRENKNSIVEDDKLKLFKFPPEEGDREVSRVLNDDFPEWKDQVKSQGFSLATFGASKATAAFQKAQVILKVNSYLRENIFPQIKAEAKKAGTQAAKDYVNGQKVKIIAKALIPIVGTLKAREYGKEVQKTAIVKAKQAAIAAGKMKADQLKSIIKSLLQPVVKECMDANKDQMKLIAKEAAKQILNTVVPPKSKI